MYSISICVYIYIYIYIRYTTYVLLSEAVPHAALQQAGGAGSRGEDVHPTAASAASAGYLGQYR